MLLEAQGKEDGQTIISAPSKSLETLTWSNEIHPLLVSDKEHGGYFAESQQASELGPT